MRLLYSGFNREFSYSLRWMLFEMHIPCRSDVLPPDGGGAHATHRIFVAEEHWQAACRQRDELARVEER